MEKEVIKDDFFTFYVSFLGFIFLSYLLISCSFCQKIYLLRKQKQNKDEEICESEKQDTNTAGNYNITFEDETNQAEANEITGKVINEKKDDNVILRSSDEERSEEENSDFEDLLMEILNKFQLKMEFKLQHPTKTSLEDLSEEISSVSSYPNHSTLDRKTTEDLLEESFRNIRDSIQDSFIFEGGEDPLTSIQESLRHFKASTEDEDDSSVISSQSSLELTSNESSDSSSTNERSLSLSKDQIYQKTTPEESLELSINDLSKYEKIRFENDWRRPVFISDLLRLQLIDLRTADLLIECLNHNKELPEVVQSFVVGISPISGIVTEDGQKMSIVEATRTGHILRGTGISLLEAQVATGNVLDPLTGRKMSLEVATKLGFIFERLHVFTRAERAVIGYKSKLSPGNLLSLRDAKRRGVITESEMIRLYEIQTATGGIIDHVTNLRLPIDTAVANDVIDVEIALKLNNHVIGNFTDPNSDENVTYSQLMQRCIHDDVTGFPLLLVKKKAQRKGDVISRMSSVESSRRGSFDGMSSLTKLNN